MFDAVFPVKKPLIGMVHLGPLPGSVRYGGWGRCWSGPLLTWPPWRRAVAERIAALRGR